MNGDALIESTETAGIWTIQSGIFPENAASLALQRERASASSDCGNGSGCTTGAGAT